MPPIYTIGIDTVSTHVTSAVDAAEQLHARTIIYRNEQPVAAIVPAVDLERIEPLDPKGNDRLLQLCGTLHHDAFVDSMVVDLTKTSLWRKS